MSTDETRSILICKDAGPAGPLLLGRHDLRIRWALNVAEAEAVIAETKCDVCVTSAAIARPVLAAATRANRGIATIVVLDPESWGAWREYYEAGATSVVQDGTVEPLLDAMSDATGISFRVSPRVPFVTQVGFALGSEGGAWRSVNVSATGMCLLEFPPYALGSEVDLAMVVDGRRFEFAAIVAQVLRIGAHRAVGLAFLDPSPELRTTLQEVIRSQEGRGTAAAQPFDDFESIDESTVLQLRSANVAGDALALMRGLISGGTVPTSETAAPWLRVACDHLSSWEQGAIRKPQHAPPWAHDALLARLRVYQLRWRAGANPLPEADTREILGLCQRLADTATGVDTRTLVQVTNIRAEILRTLYDPDLLYGEE